MTEATIYFSSESRTVEKREEGAIRFHVRYCKREKRSVDIMLAQVNRSHGFFVEVDQIALDEWNTPAGASKEAIKPEPKLIAKWRRV